MKAIWLLLFFWSPISFSLPCAPTVAIASKDKTAKLGADLVFDVSISNPCSETWELEVRGWYKGSKDKARAIAELSYLVILPPNFDSSEQFTLNLDSGFKDDRYKFAIRLNDSVTGETLAVSQASVKVGNPGKENVLTTWQGHDFFLVKVNGMMTDANVLQACLVEGLNVPCNDEPDGKYSDKKCLDVGLRDGDNPLMTIAKHLCNNTTPNQCPALNNPGTFQYMGFKWQNDHYSCGIVGNQWCTWGQRDLNALCVD